MQNGFMRKWETYLLYVDGLPQDGLAWDNRICILFASYLSALLMCTSLAAVASQINRLGKQDIDGRSWSLAWLKIQQGRLDHIRSMRLRNGCSNVQVMFTTRNSQESVAAARQVAFRSPSHLG